MMVFALKNSPRLLKIILIGLLLPMYIGAQTPAKINYKTWNDEKFTIGDIIRFPDISFGCDMDDRYTLQSQDSIKKLIKFLKKHPYFQIEIGSNTDVRGSEVYNLKLSEKRAEALANYVIREGNINGQRIKNKGYGERNPIVTEREIYQIKSEEDKEEAHQKNRRIDIKILDTAFHPIFYQSINDSLVNIHAIIRLPVIGFEFDKKDLTQAGKDSLLLVAGFLKKHKNVVVELGYHTDNRTNDKYSFHIDQARALSCVQFLTGQGVEQERLIAKGYGERKPYCQIDKYGNIVCCYTEAYINKLKTQAEKEVAHQANRRVELKVLRTDFISGR